MPVVNIIKDLLLLAASACTDPLDIETLIINTIEDLLLLAASTYTDLLDAETPIINTIKDLPLAVNTCGDPPVLKQITYT